MTTILLETETISPNMTLNLHVQTVLTVTAKEAQRLVNCQVVPQLGTGLVAIKPELMVANNKIFWRVPIKLSLPNWGDLGEVGTIMVNARSGKLLFSPKKQERIINHARWLYQGATLQTNVISK